jgi:ABC-2 type transport system ATP-binding protein
MTTNDTTTSSVSALGLECRGLALSFGRVRALDGFNLTLTAGEAVGIVGRNGAGKSTLFRAIIGAESLERGTILSTTPTLTRLHLLARTGFVPDTLSAYDWMSVGESIAYVAALQPNFDAAWSRELQALLELDLDVRVSDLSRGMQARLAFVLGLSHKPDLVLLDEPLLGVDAVTHDAVLEMLARMRATHQCTMLIASHQLGDLARLTDRVVFMDRGRDVSSINTDELASGSTRLIVRGLSLEWKPNFDRVHFRRQDGACVLTLQGDVEPAIKAILANEPRAQFERVTLSINEACADRLRAMEAHL